MCLDPCTVESKQPTNLKSTVRSIEMAGEYYHCDICEQACHTHIFYTELIEALSDEPTATAVATTADTMQPGAVISGVTTDVTIMSSSGTQPMSNVPITDVSIVTETTCTEPTPSDEGINICNT